MHHLNRLCDQCYKNLKKCNLKVKYEIGIKWYIVQF